MKDRVLAFGCHPDDIEFMAAGTLALLAMQGYEIHMATMTGGEVGSPSLTCAEIKKIRLAEAARGAAVLDAKFHYAEGCDLEVEYNSTYRKNVARIVREIDPLIVLTHAPMDYMIDHEETSRLVRNACYIASIPLYDCGASTPHTRRFPYLYYWNAMGLSDIFGRPLPIGFGVDVGSVMETKKTMLACHVSQSDWLMAHNKFSYIDIMADQTLKQGQLIGREYGECFIQHLGNGHPKDNILKKLLGDLCVTL
jgi:LmbE family N-acetylglucosaminyl deacetylase